MPAFSMKAILRFLLLFQMQIDFEISFWDFYKEKSDAISRDFFVILWARVAILLIFVARERDVSKISNYIFSFFVNGYSTVDENAVTLLTVFVFMPVCIQWCSYFTLHVHCPLFHANKEIKEKHNEDMWKYGIVD